MLAIRLVGTPDERGGLVMQSGRASYGPPSAPTQYQGEVVGLDGSQIDLSLTDASGTPLGLRVDLVIDGGAVHGTVHAGTPVAAGVGAGDDGGR